MRRTVAFLVGAVLSVNALASDTTTAEEAAKVPAVVQRLRRGDQPVDAACGLQETLVKLENRYMEAIRDHDEDALRRLSDPDKLITYADGRRQSLDDFLQEQKNWTILGFRMSDPQFVATSPDSGILNFRMTTIHVIDGRPVTRIVRGSTVWVRRWQSVAYHETEIEPERTVLNMPPRQSLPANAEPMTAPALALEKSYWEALRQKDRPALRRLTAPEKFVVLRNGSPLPQGELLDSLGVRWGAGNWYYHLDDVRVISPSEDCLIISYRASIGEPKMLRSTSTWVRRWQTCLYHETYLAPPQRSTIQSGAAYPVFPSPMGSGPAGPAVAREPFARPWTTRKIMLLGAGDSVTAGYGVALPYSYFSRLVANPKDEFADMRGVCLSAVLPNLRAENLASPAGGTSIMHADTIRDRLLPQDADTFGLVVITTGGNDLIHDYGRSPPREGAMYGATAEQARPWIDNFRQRLEEMISLFEARFPGGCAIFLADIYDPSDGVGGPANVSLPRWPDFLAVLAAYNRAIHDAAARHKSVHIVPVHAEFLGHGVHCQESWREHHRPADPHYWYGWNFEDPNVRGHDAIRRLFLIEIAKQAEALANSPAKSQPADGQHAKPREQNPKRKSWANLFSQR